MSLHYSLRFITLVNSHTFPLGKQRLTFNFAVQTTHEKKSKDLPRIDWTVSDRDPCMQPLLLLQSTFSIRWLLLSLLCRPRLLQFHGSIFFKHLFLRISNDFSKLPKIHMWDIQYKFPVIFQKLTFVPEIWGRYILFNVQMKC